MANKELTLNKDRECIHMIMPWYQAQETVSIPKSDLDPIVKVCCEVYDILPSEVHINTREETIRECRQVIHFISKLATPHTLKYIGENVGRRNHATVLNSHKSVTNLYDTDKVFRSTLEEICFVLDIPTETLEEYLETIRKRQMSIAS